MNNDLFVCPKLYFGICSFVMFVCCSVDLFTTSQTFITISPFIKSCKLLIYTYVTSLNQIITYIITTAAVIWDTLLPSLFLSRPRLNKSSEIWRLWERKGALAVQLSTSLAPSGLEHNYSSEHVSGLLQRSLHIWKSLQTHLLCKRKKERKKASPSEWLRPI